MIIFSFFLLHVAPLISTCPELSGDSQRILDAGRSSFHTYLKYDSSRNFRKKLFPMTMTSYNFVVRSGSWSASLETGFKIYANLEKSNSYYITHLEKAVDTSLYYHQINPVGYYLKGVIAGLKGDSASMNRFFIKSCNYGLGYTRNDIVRSKFIDPRKSRICSCKLTNFDFDSLKRYQKILVSSPNGYGYLNMKNTTAESVLSKLEDRIIDNEKALLVSYCNDGQVYHTIWKDFKKYLQ